MKFMEKWMDMWEAKTPAQKIQFMVTVIGLGLIMTYARYHH